MSAEKFATKSVYRTSDEVAFVEGLGMQSAPGSREGRKAMLEKYIEASKKRTNWGEIKPEKAISTAKHLLAQAKGSEESLAEGRTFQRKAA